MADEQQQGNINIDINTASVGLNMDQTVNQVGKGSLTYALNAAVENFDSNSVNYQNEPGNDFCVQFPQGYVLIGEHSIYEQNKHIFFLYNPVEEKSEIGYMENNDCVYRTYINANCLNFSVNHPIHKVVHKITNCTTEVYWTDGINPRRYLDLTNPPFKTEITPSSCTPVNFTDIDCNKLKVQPNFKIPQIQVSEIRNGGSLVAGTYQFAIQYCDALANGYTSYYSITNPTPIADTRVSTLNFDYSVGNSIVIDITNLDTTGYYEYFNLAVIKTINGVSSVELVGTYFIDKLSEKIIYSGQVVSDKQLNILDIFEKFPYYDIAQDITTVQDILVWDNLTSIDRINYQSIANKIDLKWESYRIPETENYSDELNATNLRGYLRDEVYAFEIVFLLKNGKQTDGFHIPGRVSTPNDLVGVLQTNDDFIGTPDPVTGTSPYWKIYNTASVIGFSPEYTSSPTYKGPYQYGEFAYWESEEEYPCNVDLWGNLAGEKIRHHKFPDVLVSPIFESKIFTSASSMVMSDNAVFPLGVRIDPSVVAQLISNSNLTSEQKDDIVGFKIVRGDRANHKSIVAKGILRNVGDYTREGTKYYFPNYPYNDLREDPFLLNSSNAYTARVQQTGGVSQLCRSFTIYTQNEDARVEYQNCNDGEITNLNVPKNSSSTFCALNFPKPTVLANSSGSAPRHYIEANTYRRYKVRIKDNDCKQVIQNFPGPVIFGVNITAPKYVGFYDPNAGPFALQNYFSDPNTSPPWGPPPPGYATWLDWLVNAAPNPNINNLTSSPITIPIFFDSFNPYEGESFYFDSLTFPVLLENSGGFVIAGCWVVEEIASIGEALCNPKPLKAFENADNKYRLVFNSPETSFGKPFLGDILKLENVIFGAGKAHFVQVKDNAFYKLLSKEAQEDAWNSSVGMAGTNIPARFAAYQSYLTIYINGITRRNYSWSFNSIAKYSYHKSIANGLGIKQRNLDIAQYINPTVQSVNDVIDINNWNRESSVFLRTDLNKPSLPFSKDTFSMISGGTSIVEDNSRFVNSDLRSDCNDPGKLVDINTVVYYASLKNFQPSQYGQIYQYTTIDTGYQIDIPSITSNTKRIIFGGDTFINAFAFKTKLPFFIENRVGAPDDSDVFYDELGNVAYPKYWHSARSILSSIDSLTNFISFKACSFDCSNKQSPGPPNPGVGRTYYDGKMYQFAYGIPSFYCESSVNVDLRQAFNDREGEFWPHVTTGIPDDWVQENRVPISQDNTYYYNATFSKQNKENFFSHLPVNWEPKLCFTHYPFRAIYSDVQQSYVDNQINNWLIYRPVSFFDFPQNYGKLTSLDGIQNRAVLARFENKSLLYNTMLTVETSNPQAAYLGNNTLFRAAPPIDFAETDLGYVGCQNKMLLKIPQGQVTIDAKRGQIFLIAGNQATDLTAFGSGMNRFFTDHLAFEILRYFPNVNTDNHFNGIGLHGVYDSKYDRVIITKLDYIPINDKIKYDDVKKEFYIENSFPQNPPGTNPVVVRNVVDLTDEDYFCNKSWTISYNFNTKSWVSFHSYIPNWYIGESNFFYSGSNSCCSDLDGEGFSVLAGQVSGVIVEPTTTTTTTEPSPTTTTTTTAGLDCVMTGGTALLLDCSMEGGSGLITVPSPTTTTICQRPDSLQYYVFFTGYTLPGDPTIDLTGSLEDACDAISILSTPPEDTVVTTLYVYTDVLEIGHTLFSGVSDDCTLVADGWYITDESIVGQYVYHVVGGTIIAIESCIPPTTTTTTTL